MLTDRDLRLARNAARKLLPAKLEDFKPTKSKPPRVMAIGVYEHGSGYRARVRQPDKSYRYICFPTYEQAATARAESLKQ